MAGNIEEEETLDYNSEIKFVFCVFRDGGIFPFCTHTLAHRIPQSSRLFLATISRDVDNYYVINDAR